MNILKKIYFKLKDKLSDGSIDSYHYRAILQCLAPISLLLFLVLEFFVIKIIHTPSQSAILMFIEFAVGIIFFVFNIFAIIFYIKKWRSYLKSKDRLLSILLFPTFLLLLYVALFWLTVISAEFHNFFNLLFNFNFPNIEPYRAAGPVVSFVTTIIQIMFLCFFPISISLLMNGMLPESLQKKDVTAKQKIIRTAIKISIIIVAILLSFIFSIINKENFGSISILTTLFTFICTPKTILRLFSNQKNIELMKISEDILTSFDRIKFIYYEFIFAWSISIYIFNPNTTKDRLLIFLISLFILLFITSFVQIYLKNKKSDSFAKWIVDIPDEIEPSEEAPKEMKDLI